MLSLYERIGGTEMVEAIVDLFYEKVLLDMRLKHFFDETSMDHLYAHQKLFIMYIFGGAGSYVGKSMRDAHRHLVENMGLDDEHFDAMIENLENALIELDLDADSVAEAIEITESLRHKVLNR